MLNDLNTNQILIKDRAGKFRVAQVGSGNDKNNQDEAVKPIRTTLNIPADQVCHDKILVDSRDKKEGANFYFSVEDDQEIKKIKKNKLKFSQQQLSNIIQAYAQAVLDKSMLDLSLGLKRRLLRIVESRLRDIRDLIETKEVLKRSPDLGGIGLAGQQVAQVIKIIEQERAGIEELMSQTKDFKESLVDQVRFGFNESSDQNTVSRDGGTEGFQSGSKPYVHPSYQIKENIVKESQEIKKVEEEIKKDVVSVDDKPVEADSIGSDEIRSTPLQNKDRISRLGKRVTGPIEELEQITVEEFRDLGASLDESVGKIINKLKLLEDESVNERSKGLAAWRRSPLYSMYLSIGQKSIADGKSIERYIEESKEKDKTMSFEEFEAIADLNKKLSF